MSRSARLTVLGAAVVVVFALAGGLLAPAPAHALGPCDVPGPVQLGCEVAEVGKDVGEKIVTDGPADAIGDVVAAPVKAAGDEVMKGITNWVGNGASWLIGQAGRLIDETTTPRIQSPWFVRQYGTMAALAAVFALPLLLLAVMQALVRQDMGQLVRSAFVHLPLAFGLTAAAVTVVQLLLQLTDAMSAQVASSVGSDAAEFFKDTGKSLGVVLAATGGNPVPLFAVFLGALVAAAGAFCVWLELLVRSAAIYVAVLFLPFTFVAMIWPQTARWCRKLVEVLVAVIAAKFVIVAIMALAAAGLGQSRGEEAFQGVLAGAALMLLAAFSPFVLLKLLPFAEAAIASAGGGRGALGRSLPGASVMSPAMAMRMAMDRNNGGGGGGLRAAPAGAGGASGGGSAGGGGGAGAGAGPVAAGAAGVAGARAAGGAARSRGGGVGRYGSLGGRPEAPADARPHGDRAAGGAGASPRPGGSAAPTTGTTADPARDAGAARPHGSSAAPARPAQPSSSGSGERPVDPAPRLPRPRRED